MLFVHPDLRVCGLGRSLMNYALKNYNVKYVDVNEQNIQSIMFYKHLGFEIINRLDTDAQGHTFPILQMEYQPFKEKNRSHIQEK